jgi:hypothetical protein
MLVRNWCKDLLVPEELERYRELYEGNDDENLQSEWDTLLDKFYNSDEDVGSSDNEGQANLRDDFEIYSETMREKTIAYHQLKAFSLYLEGKPAQTAAYHDFLVSIYSLLCIIYYCRDNNLTPSFCRWTTVARLLQTRHQGSHWYLLHRGDLSRLRWGILMWKLPRLRGAAGGTTTIITTTTTTMMTTTTTMTTTTVINNHRVGASFWFPELNADATIRGWRAFLRRSETAKGRQRMGGPPSNAFDDDEASRFSG